MNIGILGLGVMGRSLAQNFARNGYSVAGYDLNLKFDRSLFKDRNIELYESPEELASALDTPRCILMMVPAGKPVDMAIVSMQPYLDKGDILIDGGNSFFPDTEQRIKRLSQDGFRFIGMGVSGGESGALWGPSLMPGGDESAWEQVKPMLESISARAEDGAPCVAWMGRGGAGHYVKMVHNGIEYGDMQLIAEVYDLLHRGAGLSNGELAEVFAEWNQSDLKSYLIEITSKILRRLDETTGKALVDLILDEAEQKGTGRWTSQNSLEIGALVPTIYAAVEMRLMSALKGERVSASKLLDGNVPEFAGDREQLIHLAEKALYVSKITSYAQGFALLRSASKEYDFGFQFADIARIWRAGCIIRAALLDDIAGAFEIEPELPNLLLTPAFREIVWESQSAWREVVKTAIDLGIPMMATSASLAYFDAYRSERLPANLIQAQRDFFGAH
ncbi:MAG TPA: NADP-dependent phosphogluconate dehydrogenase, partial [Anaerolineales bacterium]|nr:NADP-dependent phosphogluconate dehydrogenase [Anaerolineales bacterium]